MRRSGLQRCRLTISKLRKMHCDREAFIRPKRSSARPTLIGLSYGLLRLPTTVHPSDRSRQPIRSLKHTEHGAAMFPMPLIRSRMTIGDLSKTPLLYHPFIPKHMCIALLPLCGHHRRVFSTLNGAREW